MSKVTILVIDDSATIRKLVNNTLSPLGYVLHLAATAEEGLERAAEVKPAMILLDHQLPGTTGFDVATQLFDSPELNQIPVVISSTLRNKAYLEYSDLPNVVDMLPKPYAAELLISTVANAVETGAMIVQSQTAGSAVPEVINELADADLQGSMNAFSIREILDLLNNGEKSGVLEVEAGYVRTWFYLKNGRIQGVTSNGHDQETLMRFLPDALKDLAPVLELASGSGMMNQVDGLVRLLNRKVLDPRLLGRLLRYQAALIVYTCFTSELVGFRFDANKTPPPMFERLPLDVSLLALLVDAATHCAEGDLPEDNGEFVYTRRLIRGQNLDRTGLAARQIQLLKLLSEPHSLAELTTRTDWEPLEVRRVLFGMSLADLVGRETKTQTRAVLALETNPESARRLRELLMGVDSSLTTKVVRDRLALQLVLRRTTPDLVIFAGDAEDSVKFIAELQKTESRFANTRWIAIGESNGELVTDATIARSDVSADLLETITLLLSSSGPSSNEPAETLTLGAL